MSAIWGCIDMSGKPVEDGLPEVMSRCTKKFKIDKTTQFIEKNVYMACGLQYITKESHNERMPFCEKGIYFTSDCLLSDREGLLDELRNVGKYEISENTPDGDLLFYAFREWGEKFGDHVLGLFSFVVYDSGLNEFYIYTDHTSSRCIHYCIRDEKVYFGTLTDCIVDALPETVLSDKFMTASQVLDISSLFLFEGLTPFEDIFIIPYGSGIMIKKEDSGPVKKQLRYWDPIKNLKQDRRFDDEKYREEFVTTHINCVKDAVRTEGEVGIFLSSGLDSTSVASAAAVFLNKENKKLNSYTSIPLKDFREENSGKKQYYIDDESEGVLKLCEKYSNIVPNFLSCEGESPWTYLEEWNDYMEIPGKAYVNHVWIRDSMKLAAEQGCRVVFEGCHGNYTISHGSIEETIVNLIKRGHPVKAVKQMLIYTRKERITKKRYVKYFIKCIFPKSKKTLFDNTALKKDIGKKYNNRRKWKKFLKNTGGAIQNYRQRKFTVAFNEYFQMNGVYNTKDGLYNGIIIRDPTMDKRMIELCLKLPYQCYAWDGTDRRLVREYLKEYVPDEIRLVNRHRGRQSGDIVMRMDRFLFPDGKHPWEKVTENIERYYNMGAVIEGLKKQNTDEDADWKLKVLSCSLFLKKYKNHML